MRGSWSHIWSLTPYEVFLEPYLGLLVLYEGNLELFSELLVPRRVPGAVFRTFGTMGGGAGTFWDSGTI